MLPGICVLVADLLLLPLVQEIRKLKTLQLGSLNEMFKVFIDQSKAVLG